MATTNLSNWIICPDCHGDGHNAKHLGVISTEDWDSDELDNYFSGAYDKPCTCCKGTGKIRESDYTQHQSDQDFRRENYRMQCAEDGIRCDWNDFN